MISFVTYGKKCCLLLIIVLFLAQCQSISMTDKPKREEKLNTAKDDFSHTENGYQGLGDEQDRDLFHIKQDSGRWRIALLLPLTGDQAKLGLSTLQAALLAYFEAYDPRIVMIPIDTEGSFDGADKAIERLKKEKFDLVIGPILSDITEYINKATQDITIPFLNLSANPYLTKPDRYVFGITPEVEIRHIISHAASRGDTKIAAIVPIGPYGDQVLQSLGDAISESSLTLNAYERYPRLADSLFEPVKRITNYTERKKALDEEISYLRSLDDDMTDEIAQDLATREVMDGVPYDAVFLSDGGAILQTLAPLFPFYEVDNTSVNFYGTGLMNSLAFSEDTNLRGARFAAPPLDKTEEFIALYSMVFTEKPEQIAVTAYDAVSLAAIMVRRFYAEGQTDLIADQDVKTTGQKSPFSRENFVNDEGFSGLTGLFRFHDDGLMTRSLAILEITSKGLEEKVPPLTYFPEFGSPLKGVFPPLRD